VDIRETGEQGGIADSMQRIGMLDNLGLRESTRYATGLSNCPKLSDNPRIKTVEYTVACALGRPDLFIFFRCS
jgi:hypothetical protein